LIKAEGGTEGGRRVSKAGIEAIILSCVADQYFLGGSLGWKTRGALDTAFEKAAYELEPSTTGNPKYTEMKTRHGYHIIMVEGRR